MRYVLFLYFCILSFCMLMNDSSGTEKVTVDLTDLENLIGYHFKSKTLLEEALTASSYSQEHPGSPDYQRLELLGDRVISLILTENLVVEGSLDEGKMTFLKAELENNQRLAEYGEEMGLREYIKAREAREELSSNVIADVFEAICGAIYLDSGSSKGIEVVEQFLRNFSVFERLKEKLSTVDDFLPVRNRFENKFREIYHDNPDIRFTYEAQGAAHQKQWRIESCAIKDVQSGNYVELKGVQSAQWFTSKKEAETDVIEQAYRYMEATGWKLQRS